MTRRSAAPLAAALGALALAAPAQAAAPAAAHLETAEGEEAGVVTLTETPAGLMLDADLKNLPQGVHGFHIHETGSCSPDFSAAGGHLVGDGDAHGFLETDEPHAGDIPNIHVPASGELRVEVLNTRAQLEPGGLITDDETIRDEDGAAIVIHAGRDDYRSQPAGAAGARIACGVIRPSK